MRVAHRGLCFGVPQAIQPDRHRRVDLIEQRGVAMTKRMEAALRNFELLQQRMKLALPNQTVIPRRARFRCEEQAKRIRTPGFHVPTQMFHQLRRDRETAIALARLHRLNPTAPHTLANVNYGVFQIQITNPQGANLATPDSGLGQNRVERLVGLAGGGDDKPRVFQRKGKGIGDLSWGTCDADSYRARGDWPEAT